MVGSFGGWVAEVLFRRLFSAKKWVNPGFMKGPWLPIYGFGVMAMFAVCYLCITFLPSELRFFNPFGGLFGKDYVSAPTFADLIPISLTWLSACLLEFLVGTIFIRGAKVRLWDYSNIKGNYKGIVCPLFSAIWLVVAVVFYYGVDPLLYMLSSEVYAYMFGAGRHIAHFGFIFLLGIFYGLLIYDFAVSIEMFKRISRFAKEFGLQERYESLKQKWKIATNRPTRKVKPASPIKEKLAEMIYIDPEKEKKKNLNYDSKGRPIREKDE